MNPTELKAFAGHYARAWCSRDPEKVAAFFSENGSLRVNDGVPAVGREAVAEVVRGFMAAFPDMQVALDDLVAQSGGAVFHWTLTGTNTGQGGTGRRIRISGYEVWAIDADGRIAASDGRFDAAEYDRQLRQGVDG